MLRADPQQNTKSKQQVHNQADTVFVNSGFVEPLTATSDASTRLYHSFRSLGRKL